MFNVYHVIETHLIMKTFITLLILGLTATSISSCERKGCTDPIALNYSVDAINDNGVCLYPTNILINQVTIEFTENRHDDSSWDDDGAPDTFIKLDDRTSEEIIHEVHKFFFSDTIQNNESGVHVFNLVAPMEIEVIDRKPHFQVSLYDSESNGEVSELMCQFDFNDLSWYTKGDNKFPSTIMMTRDNCRITMEVKWCL